MTTRDTITFVKTFLDRMNQEDIPMASLRYKVLDEEAAFRGDYDFIASQENVHSILRIFFSLASTAQINFVINRAKYGKVKIVLFNAEDRRSVVLEIWTHLEVKDRDTLRYIFFEDIREHIIKEEDRGYQLTPEVEALYYLSHLATKKKNLRAPDVQLRLRHYKNSLKMDHPGLYQTYDSIIENEALLTRGAKTANRILVEKGVLFTRKNAEKKRRERILRLRVSRHRIYGKWLRRMKIIPVVGPDGVGKTTMIDLFKGKSRSKIRYYRFKSLFRHNILYQLSRPFLRKKLAVKVQKNQYDDIYGSWMITIAWLRFPLLLLASLLRGNYFLCDRYFHDFIIKDTRFSDRKARFRDNWRKLLKKTPASFWLLHLDAATQVVLSRKQELNADDIDTYRRSIFQMILEKPPRIYSYINTTLPIEHCVTVLLRTAGAMGIKAKP